MKILETQRLSLQELALDDAGFLLELMNEPDFVKYVAERGLRTIADAAEYLSKKILPSYTRHGFGLYRVELKESPIALGICGLLQRDILEAADVGFAILERFRGNGYAYEAATAIMNHGRNSLGLAQIVGITAPDNQTSIRLLEKLGLTFQRKIHLQGYCGESLVFG